MGMVWRVRPRRTVSAVGRMIDLPEGIPMYTHDLRQELDRVEKLLGRSILIPEQKDGQHNSLADARHNVTIAKYLEDLVQEVR
jgi:hypothetical protein